MSLACKPEERRKLRLNGLLPPAERSQEQQVEIEIKNLQRIHDNLDRYIYMRNLQDRDERLFYSVIKFDIELTLPIIYTPTVGLACQNYSLIYSTPRGLFISYEDKGNILDVLCNWPISEVKFIVVTDGERILGLGDLGANGMGIPIGKLALYCSCAGVNPEQCLPITLDVGTNNEEILSDPSYIGLRRKRIRGEDYDSFIDEFIKAVKLRFGEMVLIQFEDFGNQNAFNLLDKYRNTTCTFNDDIQGTASVALAGILASLRITNKKLSENTFLFQGAGEAAIGIASLLVKCMIKTDNIEEKCALSKIWMVDSKGLLVKDRTSGGITEHKRPFARDHPYIATLEAVVKHVKPTAIIGVAAIPEAFTEVIIKQMASHNERPIIFALSNPTSKAECSAQQAYGLSEGRALFASGSPFSPVSVNGTTLYPGQGNNAYIFPAVGFAVVLSKMKTIPEDVFIVAANSLANSVSDEELMNGRLYPALNRINEVSFLVTEAIIKFSYEHKLATHLPQPTDLRQFICENQYNMEKM